MLREFHTAFNAYIGDDIPSLDIPEEIKKVRLTLINEEVREVNDAINNKEPIHDLAKELADLVYVTLGTVEAFGLRNKFEEIFTEVHRSNMSKLDKNGKPILREDGKVLKSELFTPADIKTILEK